MTVTVGKYATTSGLLAVVESVDHCAHGFIVRWWADLPFIGKLAKHYTIWEADSGINPANWQWDLHRRTADRGGSAG